MKILAAVTETCSKCGKICWFEYYERKGKVYCYSCFNKK